MLVEKIFCSKHFLSWKNIFGPKKLLVNKIVGQKKILVEKKFCAEKLLGWKKILVRKKSVCQISDH